MGNLWPRIFFENFWHSLIQLQVNEGYPSVRGENSCKEWNGLRVGSAKVSKPKVVVSWIFCTIYFLDLEEVFIAFDRSGCDDVYCIFNPWFTDTGRSTGYKLNCVVSVSLIFLHFGYNLDFMLHNYNGKLKNSSCYFFPIKIMFMTRIMKVEMKRMLTIEWKLFSILKQSFTAFHIYKESSRQDCLLTLQRVIKTKPSSNCFGKKTPLKFQNDEKNKKGRYLWWDSFWTMFWRPENNDL